MPIYYVSLSFQRPPNYGDTEVVELLRQAAERAACSPIEVTAVGVIVECEAAALDLLETAVRTKLGARGGSLEMFVVRRM